MKQMTEFWQKIKYEENKEMKSLQAIEPDETAVLAQLDELALQEAQKIDEEQARETAQAITENKSFSIAFNKADTTRDELACLLAESKRIAEKQRSNIKRIGNILGVSEKMMRDFD